MPEAARFLQLADDLEQEAKALDAIAAEAAQCRDLFSARAPTMLELRGAGDIVHDFYNAVEHFFERVANELNGGLPAGNDWHSTLLARMARELPGVRPAVLRAQTRLALEEYLRFRHLFRHRYGFDLDWTRLAPLVERMGTLHGEIRTDFDAFITNVRALAERLSGES